MTRDEAIEVIKEEDSELLQRLSHDELLAKINALEETTHRELSNTLILGSATPFQALRAVVELHKPYNSVNACTFDDLDYPCPTIQAIEKELS